MTRITNPEVIEIAQWLEDNPDWKDIFSELLKLSEDLRKKFIQAFLEQRTAK